MHLASLAAGSHAPMILRIKKVRQKLTAGPAALSWKLWLANVFGDGESRLRILKDILP